MARLGGVVSVAVVLAAAGYMVVDEMTRTSALDAPVGRSWEDYASTTGAGTVGLASPVAAPVALVPATVTAAAPPSPAAAPRPRRGVSPTALTPIGTVGATDGRRVPDGRPPVVPAASRDIHRVAPPSGVDGKSIDQTSVDQRPTEPPKEAIMAAGEDKPAAEPAKPKKKKAVRRKPRTETVDQSWGGYRRADAWQRNGWGQSWGGQRQGGFFRY
ncbi:hypothetical protein [Rhodoplanes azumiensis]|uniref:Translation initiation factor IF-2 n=1 Tax=Rhodoplanes azumiensis TaxID=1897628 RepID=A0ABW5AJL6_9BRAD